MNKLLIVAAASLISVSAFAAAQNNSGVYVNINGGANIYSNSKSDFEPLNRTGWDIGGALGYRFNDNVRAEAQFTYLRNTGDDQIGYIPVDFFQYAPASLTDIARNQYVYLANLYYDFGCFNNFVPYVGVGAGLARVNDHAKLNAFGLSKTLDESQNNFAAQGTLGINYLINEHVALGVNYRFLPVFVSGDDNDNKNIYNNLFGASLTFSF